MSGLPRGVLVIEDDGTVVKGIVRSDEIRADSIAGLAVHGAYQVCADSTAGLPTREEREKRFRETWERIKRDGWPFDRTAQPASLAEAVARAKGVTVATAAEAISRLSREDRKRLADVPAVKVALAEIRLERAKKAAEATPDVDAVLASLGV